MNGKGLLSVDEALAVMLSGARPVAEIEEVLTLEAAGRVLARAQTSTMDVPPMDNSAMDGYAVRRADVAAPDARLRVAQRIAAGAVGRPLEPGTAARIFTGAPIPAGADAIVMQEFCAPDGDHVVVKKVPQAEEWVRRRGSDICKGATILEAGIRLRPQDTGLAASVGIKSLPVYRRVRLALFFTGDELVMPGDPLPPGRIYNSNRFTLNGLANTFDCEVRDFGIVPDSLAATREVLRRAAAESDIIVTSGGVSVGEEDHVKPAVEAEGSLLMWKIAMKPGRPLAFGKSGPGVVHRPSRQSRLELRHLSRVRAPVPAASTQGIAQVAPRAIEARADFAWPQPDPRREFLRVKWNARGGLDLYPTQDSAVLTSTAWADGLVDNPPNHPIAPGDRVRFLPFAELYG